MAHIRALGVSVGEVVANVAWLHRFAFVLVCIMHSTSVTEASD